MLCPTSVKLAISENNKKVMLFEFSKYNKLFPICTTLSLDVNREKYRLTLESSIVYCGQIATWTSVGDIQGTVEKLEAYTM